MFEMTAPVTDAHVSNWCKVKPAVGVA